MSAVASLACGVLPRGLPIRYPLALTGGFLATGTLAMLGISSSGQGYFAGGLFGLGIGGVLTLLPIPGHRIGGFQTRLRRGVGP
jgi:MFS transporter, OFA family, oxalate/formate antiporter